MLQGELMDKIMVCKKISCIENDDEILFFKLPDRWEDSVDEGQFIYILNEEQEKSYIDIAQITEIDSFKNTKDQNNIVNLSENRKICLVSEEYFIPLRKKIMKKHHKYSVKELRKYFKTLLIDLKEKMENARFSPLDDKRKEYLLKLFYGVEIDKFYKLSKREKSKWFYESNNFELDFVHIINLYKLKDTIIDSIEMNNTISDEDKLTLKSEYLNELEMLSTSISRKGITRYKSNEAIGIDFSSDGKNIILGKLTDFEFYLSLASYWNIVKNLLTVSFIPILVVLLDSEKKIIIYSFLGVVYLITLILSDEKQSENIIAYMKQIGWKEDRRSNCGRLFLFANITLLVFIIFSIQIVYMPKIIASTESVAMYLIGDILFATTVFTLAVVLVEFFFYLITHITSTLLYIKRAKLFSAIFLFCIKEVFWVLSVYCLYYILGINRYFNNSKPDLIFVFYMLAGMISFGKVIQSALELIKKVRNNILTKY
jgi:hypothetical protein